MLQNIGFCFIPVLTQLFCLTNNIGTTTAALAKIVDDFLIRGKTKVVDEVIRSNGQAFTLGTIVLGLECCVTLVSTSSSMTK